MTDVNQEADMGYVRDFVQKIAEALVAATELPKQMEAIKLDLHNLNVDLDRTKQRNIELDTLTGDLRRQRDEAEQALSTVKADRAQIEHDLANANASYKSWEATANSLRDELAKAKSERDDYGLKHMAAEDRANEAEAKLKKLREALGMVETPALSKPEPEPMPTTEPPKPVEPKRIYEGELGYPYNSNPKGMIWDREEHKYYIIDDMPF